MRTRVIPLALAAIAASGLALAACAPSTNPSGGAMSTSTPGASTPDTSTPSTRPPFQTTTPGPVGSTAPTGTATDVPAAKWDALVADLAGRGVTETPTLVSAEAVTFSDSSLGCASPGQSYTQALVEGLRVVVTAGGQTYDYRFGSGDAPKLCTR
ncbi:hypothetical protein [Microbacterium sp.]|uniref:hypothetical protein n=1 Tax=Microbacterium sp. TaxID=51671 RepID=UPI0025F91793|nr:hypothetical protein [Microbacterium sp.]